MPDERTYLTRAHLVGSEASVERCDDVTLTFDAEPPESLIAARLACALIAEEPDCNDVQWLQFTRIA